MSSLQCLSHDRLLTRLHDLIQRDHSLEAELIAHLGEVDARRLYLEKACPSMFVFCVHALHFAEGVAYKRIAVARAARKFPELLVALETGDLHLTAASLIAPHLDQENVAPWVAAVCHKTAHLEDLFDSGGLHRLVRVHQLLAALLTRAQADEGSYPHHIEESPSWLHICR